jgi:hypothetical protein
LDLPVSGAWKLLKTIGLIGSPVGFEYGLGKKLSDMTLGLTVTEPESDAKDFGSGFRLKVTPSSKALVQGFPVQDDSEDSLALVLKLLELRSSSIVSKLNE